jgi:hypothetical protein
MDQFIFIIVIVVFAILDGIAKKKKAEAQREQSGTLTPEEQDWQMEPATQGLPSHDADHSFDDWAEDDEGIPGAPPPHYVQPYDSAEDTAPSPSTAAEELIPKDVWKEIAALARGEPLPVPATPVPAPVPAPEPVEDRRTHRGPARAEHEVHRSHERFGTPVSERLRPLDTPEMHETRGASREVRSVRALLSGGGSSLKKAIILQEILGPPRSMADDQEVV